ncbi:sensor histidine kinase [Microbacterium sp. JZ101]
MTDSARGLSPAWWVAIGCASAALAAVGAPFEAAVHGVPPGWALALALLQAGAIAVAPVAPWPAIVAFAGASAALALWAPPVGVPWPWSVTGIIGFALLCGLVALRRGWRTGIWALVLPGALVSSHVLTARGDAVPANVIVALSIGAGALGVAALLGERRALGAALARERAIAEDEHAARVQAEERQRIARELHDVVAHGLSLIQVQAATARFRLPELDDAAAAEFEEIGGAARRSLGEMRRLLGVLRSGDEQAALAPVAGLADIPALARDAVDAGAAVTLRSGAHGDDLPASLQLAAYRIVQEALSNALRHAPGSATTVTVREDGGMLVIEVENSRPAAAVEASPGAGLGLRGMRERAALVGGTVDARPTAEGGFRVHAELPVDVAGERGEA